MAICRAFSIIIQWGVLFFASSLWMVDALAHESPEHIIALLDKKNQLSPDQLCKRAMAHRAVGHYPQAVADLTLAISLNPQEIAYRLELASTQLEAKNTQEALRSCSHALLLATSDETRALIYSLKAQAFQCAGKPKLALESINRAIDTTPVNERKIEWFLLRANCQKLLGLKKDRIDGLLKEMQRQPNAVLKSHWIDALIDDGQYGKALKEIDAELVDRRWKSSYLLKRARALSGLSRPEEAKQALQSLIDESSVRLNAAKPDFILLADLGVAYALMKEDKKARACLKLLQLHKAPDWIVNSLEVSLKSPR